MKAKLMNVSLENYEVRELQEYIYASPYINRKLCFTEDDQPKGVDLKEYKLIKYPIVIDTNDEEHKKLFLTKLKADGYVIDPQEDHGFYHGVRHVYANVDEFREIDPVLDNLYENAEKEAKEKVKVSSEILIKRNEELKRQVKSLMDTMGDHNNQSWWRRIKRIVWSDGGTE